MDEKSFGLDINAHTLMEYFIQNSKGFKDGATYWLV